MTWQRFLFIFFIATLSSIGYSIPMNTPKKAILPGALASAIGYMIYIYIIKFGWNYMLASFVSAFIIGSIGEAYSRIMKMPATIFVLPGLITLVPGGGMYYTMTYLIQDNSAMFQEEAITTFFIAVFLSVGIIASTMFSRSLNRFRKRSFIRTKLPKNLN